MNSVSPQPQVPVVRHFIPCDEATRWQGGGPYCLTRIRHEFQALAGGHVRTRSELCFYIQFADGIGTHTFRIQQVCLQDQTLIFPWPPFTIDFGSDPALDPVAIGCVLEAWAVRVCVIL